MIHISNVFDVNPKDLNLFSLYNPNMSYPVFSAV